MLTGALVAPCVPHDWRRRLLALPLLALLLDLAENVAITGLLATHRALGGAQQPWLGTLEGLLSGFKFTAYLAVLVAALALALERAVRVSAQPAAR